VDTRKVCTLSVLCSLCNALAPKSVVCMVTYLCARKRDVRLSRLSFVICFASNSVSDSVQVDGVILRIAVNSWRCFRRLVRRRVAVESSRHLYLGLFIGAFPCGSAFAN
jgi:hypothetical protein